MNEPVHFSPATLNWLVEITTPREVKPTECSHATLVYNEALRTIQKRILEKDAMSHASVRR